MAEDAKDFLDKDIADLNMSDAEKNGLQLYRNYNKKFTDEREKEFAASIDATEVDCTPLNDFLTLLIDEDIRFVPVIACAFADDELKQMFNTFLRDGIPGGKKALVGRFGPISSLFARIQFAYAFDMIEPSLLLAIDKLREHRNKISHTWNSALLGDFFKDPIPETEALERAMSKPGSELTFDSEKFPESTLRLKTMWLITRLYYECRYYPMAKLAGLDPADALYGKNHPKALGKITPLALKASRNVILK